MSGMVRGPRSTSLGVQPARDGVLAFERDRGRYTLWSGPSFHGNLPVAPRVLQVALLTPCNLRCSFCYRDTQAESRLSRGFLVPFLQSAADWGVLEVAFGGGEPLLFRELEPMLEQLAQTTALGLNVTTNAMLLTEERVARLRDHVGEWRVSAYAENDYQNALLRMRSLRVGLNLMVTPRNVGHIEVTVRDALQRGARDVLLLSYKGSESALHLRATDRERLRRALERMSALPLRLDICLYPHFSELPHLFPRDDCGAGSDFLAIAPDRTAHACSFSSRRFPFETIEDLQRIWTHLCDARPPADAEGCTRERFAALGQVACCSVDTVWQWSARASNNSGDSTVLAEFCDDATAELAASELRRFFEELHRFYRDLNQERGFAEDTFWNAVRVCDDEVPPPVAEFARKHGFKLETYSHGIRDTTETPTVASFGKQLALYHDYLMGFDSVFLERYFKTLSEGPPRFEVFGLEQPLRVRVSATGHSASVTQTLEDFFTRETEDEEPPWIDVSTPDILPWPHEVRPRAEVRWEKQREWNIAIDERSLAIELTLVGNAPAAAAHLGRWLEQNGYASVETEVQPEA